MADLLIRDLDPQAHDILRRHAEASGRSPRAEARRILESAARAADVDADRIRAALDGRPHPDSAESVRELRDR